jgi:diadenosine tetraphosphatase ApaH/serine/threonine PP2A family protein phosphatase
MRYLVLTDIHANLEALEACLAHARERRYDEALVLGDVVGYGADPNAVIQAIQDLNPLAIIRGNHDKVACGIDQADGFNPVAKSAAHWTLGVLAPEHRQCLIPLPELNHPLDDLGKLSRGSPFDEDAYIFDELDAVRALKVSSRPLCLFGHTHYPMTFELSAQKFDSIDPPAAAETRLQMRIGSKYLVNPGSVGQPRDGDPRAAYGIVDTRQRCVELFRVAYRVEVAQAKVIRAGLPEVLAQRLALGR